MQVRLFFVLLLISVMEATDPSLEFVDLYSVDMT